MHVAAGYFALHDDINTALICSGEITRDRITYDMQTVEEVTLGVAGLTLGNAAAALLITREALPAGGALLKGFTHRSLPETGNSAGPRRRASSCPTPKNCSRCRCTSCPRFADFGQVGWTPGRSITTPSISQVRLSWNGSSPTRRQTRCRHLHPFRCGEHRQHRVGTRSGSSDAQRHGGQRRQDRHRQCGGRLHHGGCGRRVVC